MTSDPTTTKVEVMVRDETHTLAYFDRHGEEHTVLYVHGLGASKSDFIEMCTEPGLRGVRLLSYDQPGCSESPASVDVADCIDVLVEILEGFVAQLELKDFLLVGGSLGGLVTLLFAERNPTTIIGFVNVEGNLAPEDCMFSRRVVPHTFIEFSEQVLPQIKADLSAQTGRGFREHLKVLARADARSYYAYSFQTVTYSDEAALLERFLALPMPIFFFHGSQNRSLTYLPRLLSSRCTVKEIDAANHFLFYDAPAQYALALREVLDQVGGR